MRCALRIIPYLATTSRSGIWTPDIFRRRKSGGCERADVAPGAFGTGSSRMVTLTFQPRYKLPEVRNPDLNEFRQTILECGDEFGEATLVYEGEQTATLILIFHDQYGYYLKYRNSDREEWLSLGDASRLKEVVTPDDWEASVGLFVPLPRAWQAIKDFCESGERSAGIMWIRPSEIPAGGNW